jgi:hypothetical protein
MDDGGCANDVSTLSTRSPEDVWPIDAFTWAGFASVDAAQTSANKNESDADRAHVEIPVANGNSLDILGVS